MRLASTILALLLTLPALSDTKKIRVFFDDDTCPSKTRLLDRDDNEDRCEVGSVWQADAVCVEPGNYTFKWMTKRRGNATNGVYPFKIVAHSAIFTSSAGPTNTCESKPKSRGNRLRHVAKCDANLSSIEDITYDIIAENCKLDPRIIVTGAAINLLSEDED